MIKKTNSLQGKLFFDNIYVGLAFVFFVSMCFLTIFSLHFGVNPYDEAFYLALPYHFIKGGHFFIDEFTPQQGAAFFTYPIIKLFYSLEGSTQGIVLFSRYIHFAFVLASVLIIISILKRALSLPVAIIVSCAYISFTPFNIHALGYNTLALGFFTLSLFLNFYAISLMEESSTYFLGKRNFFFFLSGVLIGCAVISYPTISVIVLINILILNFIAFYKKSYIQPSGIINFYPLIYYCLGLFIVAICIGPILIHVGWGQLLTDLETFKSLGAGEGGGIVKLIVLAKQIWVTVPHKQMLAIVFSLFVLCEFISALQIKIIFQIIIAIFALYIIRISNANDISFYILTLAVSGIFWFISVRRYFYSKHFLLLVWLPSLIAGIVTAWTSGNGLYNFVVGGFPAALAALYFITLLFKQALENNHSKMLVKFFFMWFLIWLIYPLQYHNLNYNYGDFPNSKLTTKITTGPFAGIYTTPNKAQYYTELQTNLNKYNDPNKNILFFTDFPLGYLMTNITPFTNVSWLPNKIFYPTFSYQPTINYYRKKNKFPDIIVVIDQVVENPNPSAYPYKYFSKDPIIQLLGNYNLVLNRKEYRIYTKKH